MHGYISRGRIDGLKTGTPQRGLDLIRSSDKITKHAVRDFAERAECVPLQ